MDRLSDFKLRMGVVIKAEKDWRAMVSGGLNILSCNAFAFATFSNLLWSHAVYICDKNDTKFITVVVKIIARVRVEYRRACFFCFPPCI